MSSPSTADALRPLFITQAVRHRWRLLVACGLLGLLAGLAYVYTSSEQYTATAQVLVNPIVGNPYSDQSTTNNASTVVAMQTEAGVVGSAADTTVVNRQLGLTLNAYPAGLTTSVPNNTQIIDVTFVAAHADRARAVAQAYAQAYLDRRQQLAQASQAARLSQLNAVAARTEAALATAAKAANGTKPDPAATAQVQVYSSQLTSVQAQIGDAQALSTDPGTLLTPAHVAPGSSKTKQALLVVAATVVGAVVGLLLAAWRERRSDLVYADDSPGPGQVPVLGRFAADAPVDRGDDQLRLIRLGLQLALEPPAVVAVTPLSAAEPVTSLGRALAGSLHSAGHTTVLVDARISGESLVAGRGLSDVVAEVAAGSTADTAEAVVELPLQSLDQVPVLGAGTDPAGARDRYAGPPLRTVLAGLREQFDYVVLLSSPGDDPLGVAVAAAADAVLVVVTERRSHYGAITELAALLEHGGSRALGTLLLRGRSGRHGRRGRRPATTSPPAVTAEADAVEAAPTPQRGRRRSTENLTRTRERR